MTHHHIQSRERDSLARLLGWFSVGLGGAQLAAPGTVARLVGASGRGTSRRVMRAFGARELASGVGILIRPRPTAFLAARVAGDLLDTALLALLAARDPRRRVRASLAAGAVVGVLVPDVYETVDLARRRGAPASGKLIRKAVTVRRSRAEVEDAVRADGELGDYGEVELRDAPGDRGTEIVVSFRLDPPGGEFGTLAKRVAGDDPASELHDRLRRLKERLETGEVTRSDAVPGGHELAEQLRQRAAQPLEEVHT